MTDDAYTKAVKAILAEHGFDPVGAYTYKLTRATLQQVRNHVQLMAEYVRQYDAAITPERKAAVDAWRQRQRDEQETMH